MRIGNPSSQFSDDTITQNMIHHNAKPTKRTQLNPLQENDFNSKLQFSQSDKEHLQNALASRGGHDICTPSTQINQSQFSSRQSNIRGFFLREQLSREDAWRQTEIKRKTKECLDQQIEDKKTFNLQNSRELQIQQFQEINNQKINNMFDKSPSNSTIRNSLSHEGGHKQIPVHNEILSKVDEEFDMSQKKKFILIKAQKSQSHHPELETQVESFSPFDMSKMQDILNENIILKNRLNEKQSVIEGLIHMKKDNIRLQAQQEIQENYLKNSKVQSMRKKSNFLLPSNKHFQEPSPNIKFKDNIFKKQTFQIKKSAPLQVPVNRIASQQSFQNQQNYNTRSDQKSFEYVMEPQVIKQPILKTEQVNQINNFTFSNNLVDSLKQSAQSYQNNNQNLNSKILREFPQDILRKKFFV